MRTMYDSTAAGDIPADAEMVAGYVDGAYAWSQADWARFPNAVKVTIATTASTDAGDVLDVELGDAVPAEAPGWARRRIAAGVARPTIYCGRAAWGGCQTACQGLPVDWWVADWTGVPHVLEGAAAVQYINDPGSGGHYDLSLVADDAWPAAHAPDTGEEEPMTTAERQDLASALAQLSYACGLRRDPTKDQAGVDYWFGEYVKSFGEAAKAFIAAPEMQKDLGAS